MLEPPKCNETTAAETNAGPAAREALCAIDEALVKLVNSVKFPGEPGSDERRRFADALAQIRTALDRLDVLWPEEMPGRKPHDWQPSPLGHGEMVCRNCCGTLSEIAAIGDIAGCPDGGDHG